MSKDTRCSKGSSRAVSRLEQGSRHESPEREEPPNRAEGPPSWAKELLQQQKLYSKELKKLKNELDDGKLQKKNRKLSDPEP